jgi:hypothetical protein
LVYVGETKVSCNKRISTNRFQINDGGNQLLYKHFNSPDHSILFMRVRILENIKHYTNNPTVSTTFRRQRENHWIRILGTVFPYGCNDNINNLGNLTSPLTNNVNLLGLFPNNKRRRCSNGHRSYNRPIIQDVTPKSLLPDVNKSLSSHYITLKVLYTVFEQVKASPYLDFSTPEYRLNSMIMDVTHHRLFKPPQINDNPSETCRKFLTLKFCNKRIYSVNSSNILHHK